VKVEEIDRGNRGDIAILSVLAGRPKTSPLLSVSEALMKFSSALLYLVIVASYVVVPMDRAEAEFTQAQRIAARRDLDQAKTDLRYYWLVEYPRQRRHINAAIDLTHTEIRNLREQLRAYGPFNRFSTGSPFLLTMQRVRLCLQEAELRLTDLQAERNALLRFHPSEFRALAYVVQDARFRVAEIEAGDEAAQAAAPTRQLP